MQKHFQFGEKDTKAQRNRIICQLSQKKSQYMKQAGSRSVLNTNICDHRSNFRSGLLPSFIHLIPSTVIPAKWTSQKIQRSLCECCRAPRHVTSSAATGTVLLYSLTVQRLSAEDNFTKQSPPKIRAYFQPFEKKFRTSNRLPATNLPLACN